MMAQDDTEPRLIFNFYLCLRSTSPNYAFMRRRLYSKRKVKEYNSDALRGETGPDGQNIFGHTDVLINDLFFCERQYCYVLRQ